MGLSVKFDPRETVDGDSDAGVAVLNLASSIEAQLTKCTELLLDSGNHAAAHSLIETMLHCTAGMRSMIVGQDLVDVE